ncbi:MAG: 6-carboxytetrahydropterin synthase QueD [Spirochaetes bacterium]|nr:6-carboxytetrahydropterin synthase QueD [Spirochaetota bacterium]HOD14465.1 6-carboxytetrahydropterin synthase QueD [Spirochaetota bacterium]HPG52620.1 6-carboxytetrahydropterin synthase QueD [Spirochaetota bacterium]
MYRLTVHDYFSSAHQLKGYQGKCEAMHGHNWKVEVDVQGVTLNDIGLLMDFHDLRRMLKEILERLDHVCLNEVEEFRESNPSSENVARHVYEGLGKKLPAGISVASVTVWESENARATYFK